MRGQNALVRMRLAGYRPREVFVLDVAESGSGFWNDPERSVLRGGLPEIHVTPDDVPGTLDFRCLAGVQVHLQGQSLERLRAIFRRMREVGPSKIIVSTPEMVHVHEAKT